MTESGQRKKTKHKATDIKLFIVNLAHFLLGTRNKKKKTEEDPTTNQREFNEM